MKKTIGTVLREARIASGRSIAEVSAYLVSKGFKAAEKTIYSWENDNSQPTPTPLLAMCALYGIDDVLDTFGYTDEDEQPRPQKEKAPVALTDAEAIEAIAKNAFGPNPTPEELASLSLAIRIAIEQRKCCSD